MSLTSLALSVSRDALGVSVTPLVLSVSTVSLGGLIITIPTPNLTYFLFSGHEPIYFIENKEKTLRASYDRGTQIVDYMD